MIKTITLATFFIILSIMLTGQCRINYVNPSSFLKEVDSLRKLKQYDLIIDDLNKRINSDSVQMWHYYQMACFYSLKGDTNKPFEFLYKNMKLELCLDDILSDSDFESLHKTLQWQKLKDTICCIYLSNYPDIKDKELSIKLWLMGIEDQKYRTLGGNQKKEFPESNSKEFNTLNKEYIKNSKEREEVILGQFNFLGSSLN